MAIKASTTHKLKITKKVSFCKDAFFENLGSFWSEKTTDISNETF